MKLPMAPKPDGENGGQDGVFGPAAQSTATVRRCVIGLIVASALTVTTNNSQASAAKKAAATPPAATPSLFVQVSSLAPQYSPSSVRSWFAAVCPTRVGSYAL